MMVEKRFSWDDNPVCPQYSIATFQTHGLACGHPELK